MNRRNWIAGVGACMAGALPGAAPGGRPVRGMRADVVIVGGGTGGCAAALAAARNGLRVILAEETDWIGGQLTTQAVPPDDAIPRHVLDELGTSTYRGYYTRVRDYYRRNYPLTPEARADRYLNPGNGPVSSLCAEFSVYLAVLYEMLAEYASRGQVTLLLEHKAVAADTQGDVVRAVTVRSLTSGRTLVLSAPYIIDATELGDLLPMTGTEYVTGAESQRQTAEPHAPADAKPRNMQPFTCCFAVDYLPGEDHTIEKPADYEYWSKATTIVVPPFPGPILSLMEHHPRFRTYFNPADANEKPPGVNLNFMRYRRIADRRNFTPGSYASDITLVNWFQNDYFFGNLCEVSEEEAARHLRGGKQLSLSLLYWLQTRAPRPDGGTGWPGLRLRPDIVGTEDGLAKYPYIRESRRIRAEFTVVEQHVSTEARMRATGKPRNEVRAETFADSVGIGRYRIDIHPTVAGDKEISLSSLPYQIPLGALIPRRVENLLPGCKNIGTTHITNGCYRLHPAEWSIGEAAGVLVKFCLERKVPPRQVRANPRLLADLQRMLRAQGIALEWSAQDPT